MDPTTRLRVATRIHFALLRQYGEQVTVSDLLQGSDNASEALWVCEASGIRELMRLAAEFRALPAADSPPLDARATPVGCEPQSMPWGQDTSGFGVSRPIDLGDAPARGQARWFQPLRWLPIGRPRRGDIKR